MYIISTKKEDQWWTDKLVRKDGKLFFDTQSKAGKTTHHEIAEDQVGEIQEMEGTLEEVRENKKRNEE